MVTSKDRKTHRRHHPWSEPQTILSESCQWILTRRTCPVCGEFPLSGSHGACWLSVPISTCRRHDDPHRGYPPPSHQCSNLHTSRRGDSPRLAHKGCLKESTDIQQSSFSLSRDFDRHLTIPILGSEFGLTSEGRAMGDLCSMKLVHRSMKQRRSLRSGLGSANEKSPRYGLRRLTTTTNFSEASQGPAKAGNRRHTLV